MFKRSIVAAFVELSLVAAFLAPTYAAEQFPLSQGLNRIPVQIGGKTLMMWLGTGSTWTVIDSRHRSLLGEQAAAVTADVLKRLEVPLYRCDDLKVGQIPARTVNVGCLSFGEPVEGLGVDGVLGMDFLKDYSVELDWAKQKLTLHDEPIEVGSAIASMAITNSLFDVPIVVGTIDGRKVRFILDTAFQGYVCMSPGDEVFALRRNPSRTVDAPRFWSVRGKVDGKVTRLPRFDIGDCQWKDVICDVQLPQEVRSLLGMRLLEAYHTIIDFPRQKLIFVRANEKADPPDINMSGMTVLRMAKQSVVARIEEGGPAEAAQIKKGDILLNVDGTECSALDIGQIERLLRSDDRKHVMLKLKSGETIREIDLVLRRRI